MVFQFRMLSDENDHFVRDYEVMYDMNLLDFHRFILRSLGYEPCMASFFTADDRWERGREFTVEDMGGGDSETAPLAMERVTLGQLIHNNRDRLIYLFDLFGDRAFYLELVGAKNRRPERPTLALHSSTLRHRTNTTPPPTATKGRFSTRR